MTHISIFLPFYFESTFFFLSSSLVAGKIQLKSE